MLTDTRGGCCATAPQPQSVDERERHLAWLEELGRADKAELRGERPWVRLSILPSPPTDSEKYHYFGSQARWVAVLQFATWWLVAISLYRFARSFSDWAGELFLFPLVVVTIWLFISFSTGIRKRRIDRDQHDMLVSAYCPSEFPSVDVFLPSAGEDMAILHNTLRYVSRMQWDGEMNVYVLDDSARDEVRESAERYGFTYLSRPDRGRLKKAGNLKYGFDHSLGDFIAVFDADFVPRSEYLYELIPHFTDNVAIVQSPQYFDAGRDMNWLERNAGATQELFYRWVQPARDAAQAAICVGTCAVYKRAALNEAGGFAQIGHSEDVHTGVNLMKVGYRTKYVPIVLAKGVCPDEFRSFINQQYRWCSGSMSLLFDTNFHRAPFRGRQKICFWAGFFYYMCTAFGIVVLPLPTILMLAFAPERVEASNYALLLIAMAIWYFTGHVITSGRSNRIGLARIAAVYSFAHLFAVVHTISRRQAAWVPTGAKTSSTDKRNMPRTVLRTMRTWLLGSEVATGGGIIVRAWEYGWVHFWGAAVLWAFAIVVTWPLIAATTSSLLAGIRPDQDLVVEDLWEQAPTGTTSDRESGRPTAGAVQAHHVSHFGDEPVRPDLELATTAEPRVSAPVV